jgi:CRP-like cAMP-binding protein
MNPAHHHLRQAINKFIRIKDDDWNLLEPHLYDKQVKKHEYFAEEGKIAKEVGFVLNGNMRHYYTRDGQEKTTYFYFENHFVAAYISCITNTPSRLTIQAITECELLVFPYLVLQQLYEQSHTWERFGRLLSEYLAIGLEDRMTGLLLLSPEERYKELLEGNKGKILERIPQHYIASYLGITPVSLSRIRNRR